jgi:hypothetical protein
MRGLRWRGGMALVLALASCAPAGTGARLEHLEAHAQEDDARIDALSVRVAEFDRAVDDVVDLYLRASAELETATIRFEQVQRAAQAAAADYERAAADYEQAATNWRLVTISILAAATWDYAGHLCDTRMTTAEYRKHLRKQGVELHGLDADHGLPRSKGGADHPLNYRMIDSSLNRSLGNDVLRKLMAHPMHLLQGAAVSALMRLRCSPQL